MEKEFEALSRIEECWYDDPYTDREDNLTYEDDIDTIKQALTTKSKKEKAFDIANKKCVDMYRLRTVDNVVLYNKRTEFDEYWLTEEEFNLIKEML